MNDILLQILNEYANFEQVQSVAIGGSVASANSDTMSDTDIYVFVNNDIPVNLRENLVKKYSSKYEVGGEYFGAGDEYFVDKLNKQLDVMFWNVKWFKLIVENIWQKFYPQNGYTTAFLYTLKNFKITYDENNWLTELQKSINTKYPQKLKENIIRRNFMLLKDKPFASYYEQISKAIERNDINSINHRIAAFMASYFDIIYAQNELLHPGEKRLIQYAKKHCPVLPENFEENLNKIFIQPNPETLKILSDMVENLRQIIEIA